MYYNHDRDWYAIPLLILIVRGMLSILCYLLVFLALGLLVVGVLLGVTGSALRSLGVGLAWLGQHGADACERAGRRLSLARTRRIDFGPWVD